MDWFDRINATTAKLTGRAVLDTELHYRILRTDPGVIQIQDVDSAETYLLVRIPE